MGTTPNLGRGLALGFYLFAGRRRRRKPSATRWTCLPPVNADSRAVARMPMSDVGPRSRPGRLSELFCGRNNGAAPVKGAGSESCVSSYDRERDAKKALLPSGR
jgi:hypothetical protein